jgi:hypothetical protein
VTLGAVADEGQGVVLEVLLEMGISKMRTDFWVFAIEGSIGTYKELLLRPVGALWMSDGGQLPGHT